MLGRVHLCWVAGNTVWSHTAGDAPWLWNGLPLRAITSPLLYNIQYCCWLMSVVVTVFSKAVSPFTDALVQMLLDEHLVSILLFCIFTCYTFVVYIFCLLPANILIRWFVIFKFWLNDWLIGWSVDRFVYWLINWLRGWCCFATALGGAVSWWYASTQWNAVDSQCSCL